jgi:hypothetical protein
MNKGQLYVKECADAGVPTPLSGTTRMRSIAEMGPSG